MRTNVQNYFLDLALRCAGQGTCRRRNYGAVIVDTYRHIISTGYTGAASGCSHCNEGVFCWREVNNIPSGSNYEKCRSVHAETNALIQAGNAARGCEMYLAGLDRDGKELGDCRPCYMCAKSLLNAGIVTVVTRDYSRGRGGICIVHDKPKVIDYTPPSCYVDKWETEIFGGKV